VYDLLELLYFSNQLATLPGVTAAGGSAEAAASGERAQERLALLSRSLGAVDAVCRGSELHVYLASAILGQAVALRGPGSDAAEAGAQLVELAHQARYGEAVSAEVMLRLMEANRGISEEFL
jgi:hypothetical protein